RPATGHTEGWTRAASARLAPGRARAQAPRQPPPRRSAVAHKKGLGSSRNGRDSNPQYLGVKLFAGQKVTGGEIIVRPRGTRFKPGVGVGIGQDDTIFAQSAGVVGLKTGGRPGVLWRARDQEPPQRGACEAR